jgi:AcrR family transcriptional regulator
MAWDTERTRSSILGAASAEFAEHGFGGARVARIATRSGVNVERLYANFGSKQDLFQSVMADRLGDLIGDARVRGMGPAAIRAFAQQVGDSLRQRGDLPRLLAWEGLEAGSPVDLHSRRERTDALVADVRAALPGCSDVDARTLLFHVLSLAYSWHVLPSLATVIMGDSRDADVSRRTLGDAAEALAAAVVG